MIKFGFNMKCLVIGILGLIFFSVFIINKDWNIAPEGFEWYESSNAKSTIPFPSGWHLEEESKNGSTEIFISKDNINKGAVLDNEFILGSVSYTHLTLPTKRIV